MGSPERIRNVAKRVAKWARAGHQMVVVPSAMSGETNRLLGLAKELAPERAMQSYHRELDMLAATGEQASSALLAIALQSEGMEAVSYAGWQVPIRTDSSYTKARIESIDDQRVRADLNAGKVVPWCLARIPRAGETRGSLAAGGTGVAQELSPRDREIAETLAPQLLKRGLLLVGLDVIGDYLTGINVSHPGGMVELRQQSGFDAAGSMAFCWLSCASTAAMSRPSCARRFCEISTNTFSSCAPNSSTLATSGTRSNCWRASSANCLSSA